MVAEIIFLVYRISLYSEIARTIGLLVPLQLSFHQECCNQTGLFYVPCTQKTTPMPLDQAQKPLMVAEIIFLVYRISLYSEIASIENWTVGPSPTLFPPGMLQPNWLILCSLHPKDYSHALGPGIKASDGGRNNFFSV